MAVTLGVGNAAYWASAFLARLPEEEEGKREQAMSEGKGAGLAGCWRKERQGFEPKGRREGFSSSFPFPFLFYFPFLISKTNFKYELNRV